MCDAFAIVHGASRAAQLLKDILEAWKAECEKKPATMSVDDAYVTLGLETGGSYACHRSLGSC